jgi:hypothetical protein
MGEDCCNLQILETMKHTPGPWIVDYAMGIRGADSSLIAYVLSDASTPTPDAQLMAAAQLIAAAPELLEALEMLITIEPNFFSVDAYERSLWENARETIAKATGEK